MPGRTVNGAAARSSRKRSSRVVDDDTNEELVEQHSASSSLRVESRKRARTSIAGPSKAARRSRGTTAPSPGGDGSDEDDPEEQEDGKDDEHEGIDSPPKTQYEEMRDGRYEHLQHEDLDDQRATQKLRFRPNLLGENHIADNGILESVECVQFMCHERLHCELGPLLNFIVGENGSGKSAILTAITLCLGGKASSTNRGGSLKSFIKEGRDQSNLIVKIKNQGDGAYRPDVYGDSIIVERHFSKTGSSGFRVKSALGRIISTKKQEVDEIVEFYCLQVDNPMNVLSQDNARQFLNASSNVQKYKYFIQGVQLEQLDNDYRLVMESLESNHEKVPSLEDNVKHLKTRLENAKRMFDSFQNQRKIIRELRLAKARHAWRQVIDMENELRDREAEAQRVEADMAEKEQAIQQREQTLQRANDKLQRANLALEETRDEGTKLTDRVKTAEEKYQDARKEIAKLHTDERDAHSRLVSAKNAVRDLEKKIEQEEMRFQDVNGGARTGKEQQRKEAESRLETITSELDSAKEMATRAEVETGPSDRDRQDLDRSIGMKRDEITKAEQQLRQLQNNQGSPYDAFDPQIPRLLRAIEADKGWSSPPIGPAGAYMQLLEPLWSPILEKTFGSFLDAFIVTTPQDRRRLQALIERLGVRRINVIIGSRHPLDIQGKEPDPSFKTILRVLKFDDDLVRNQAIINQQVEQIILIPERTKAEDVMFNGAVPRNVAACLCLHDTKRGHGLRLTTKGNGNMSTVTVEPVPDRRPRMKTDSGSQVELQESRLQSLEEELRQFNVQKRSLQQEAQRCKTAADQCRKQVKLLEAKKRSIQVDIDKIDAELDQFEGTDGRLRTLQEELKTAINDKNHHGDQFGDLNVQKGEANKAIEALKKELAAEKQELRQHEGDVKKAEQAVARYSDARQVVIVEMNQCHRDLDALKMEKEESAGRIDRQRQRVEMITDDAEKVSPRVTVDADESLAALEPKIKGLEAQIAEHQKRTGLTQEEAADRFSEARLAFDEHRKTLESIKQLNDRLKQTMMLRLDKWRNFQRFISARARTNFLYLLSERSFRGGLRIDHKNKRLAVEVEPDKNETRGKGRNTKTLSGGEKSFSSICLLLSIWEAMGSPLRCLDEFDVFMDNVNRKISTNMLINAARRSVNRQYIFITPNAIEGRSHLERDVKIIRLTDPRQRTLADH